MSMSNCMPTPEALHHSNLVGNIHPDVSDSKDEPTKKQAHFLHSCLCQRASLFWELECNCEIIGPVDFFLPGIWVGIELSVKMDKDQSHIHSLRCLVTSFPKVFW